jgi:hypothetical protein
MKRRNSKSAHAPPSRVARVFPPKPKRPVEIHGEPASVICPTELEPEFSPLLGFLVPVLFFSAGLAVWAGAVSAWAQTNDPVATTTTAAGVTTNWPLLLTPILVPVFIAGIKLLLAQFGSKLPKVWIPIAAPILGALVDLLITHTWGAGTVMAAIAGSAGVGLREIVDQLKKLGDSTSID